MTTPVELTVVEARLLLDALIELEVTAPLPSSVGVPLKAKLMRAIFVLATMAEKTKEITPYYVQVWEAGRMVDGAGFHAFEHAHTYLRRRVRRAIVTQAVILDADDIPQHVWVRKGWTINESDPDKVRR